MRTRSTRALASRGGCPHVKTPPARSRTSGRPPELCQSSPVWQRDGWIAAANSRTARARRRLAAQLLKAIGANDGCRQREHLQPDHRERRDEHDIERPCIGIGADAGAGHEKETGRDDERRQDGPRVPLADGREGERGQQRSAPTGSSDGQRYQLAAGASA